MAPPTPEEEDDLYDELAEGPGITARAMKTVREGGSATVRIRRPQEDRESQTSKHNQEDPERPPNISNQFTNQSVTPNLANFD